MHPASPSCGPLNGARARTTQNARSLVVNMLTQRLNRETALAMDGVFCFGYGAQLEGRKGDRRLIVSPNNSYVFPVLHDLVTTAMAETSSTVDRRRLS